MKVRKRKLQTKIYLMICLIILTIGVCVGITGYRLISQMSERDIGRNALSITAAAAAGIDGDKTTDILQKRKPEDTYYKAICSRLNRILKNADCTYLYAVALTADQKWVYIYDGTPMDSKDFSALGSEDSLDSYPQEARDCFQNGKASYTRVYDAAEWGKLVSAFSPVYDSTGKVIAVVGCDYSANTVLKYTMEFLQYLIAILIGFMIVSILFSTFFLKISFRPVDAILKSVRQMKEGDLTVSFEKGSRDEIGSISAELNEMAEAVRKMLLTVHAVAGELQIKAGTIKDNTADTAESHAEITQVIETISSRVVKQAQDVEQGHAGIADLSARMVHTEELILRLRDTIRDITDVKEEGRDAVEGLIEITDSNLRLEQLVQKDVRRSAEIAENINGSCEKIQEISNQTELLSLNAAIEASRAGSDGKGFTVVSEEIRKLSSASDLAAAEIDKMAEELGKNTKDTVEKIGEYKTALEEQGARTAMTKDRFERIAELLDKMEQDMEDVDHSVRYIRDFKDQVLKIMEDLSAIAQNNAASAQEAAATMETQGENMQELDEQGSRIHDLAGQLVDAVSIFRI